MSVSCETFRNTFELRLDSLRAPSCSVKTVLRKIGPYDQATEPVLSMRELSTTALLDRVIDLGYLQ